MIGRPGAGDARVVAAIFVPAAVLILVVAVVAVIGDFDTGAIFRDTASVLDGHPLVGVMSNVGIVLWWLAAGICLFTLSLSRWLALDRPVRVFLLTSGLLTVLLALDDQFLFHDELGPQIFGLRERYVMLGYLVLVGAWLLLNLRVIRRSEWLIPAVAMACFAGSIASDYIVQMGLSSGDEIGIGLDWGIVIEDGLKFMGIAGWAAYLIRFSRHQVRDRFKQVSRADANSLETNAGQ